MRIINSQVLQSFICSYAISAQFQLFLKAWPLASHLKLPGMNLIKMQKLCLKINSNDAKNQDKQDSRPEEGLLAWKKGELRLFFWLLVYYCFHHHIDPAHLEDKDFLFFQEIFLKQSLYRLRYEALNLSPPKTSMKRSWEDRQVELLKRAIGMRAEEDKRIEWKQVGYDLFTFSEGRYFRTNAQCRERWANHINPTVNKEKWSKEEDYLLMTSVKAEGTKWSEIAKEFDGRRTQHMVKNRYHSLINKWMKSTRNWSNKYLEKKIGELLGKKGPRPNQLKKEKLQLSVFEEEQREEHGEEHRDEYREDREERREDIYFQDESIKEEQEELMYIEESLHQKPEKQVEIMLMETEKTSTQIDTSHLEISEMCQRVKDFEKDKLGCLSRYQIELDYYRDKQIKHTLDDVAELLGCHPQQIQHLLWMGREEDPELEDFFQQ